MIKTYLITAYRNMLRKPGFTIINITGLAIGLAACIIILLYIADELGYDRFHDKSDRIYRMATYGVFGGNEFHSTYTAAPMAGALLDDFPEVENVTRLMLRPQRSVRVGENTFIEDRFFYADSSFFEIFDFELIAGDPKQALAEPGGIVLTQSTAKRYFGEEDPIGKALVEDNRHHYIVTGIVKDVPGNSHFKFNALASFLSLPWHRNTSWFNQSAQTYLLVSPGTDVEMMEEKLVAFLFKHIKDQLQQFIGISLEEFAESGQVYRYEMQALHDIHLHSNLDGEYEANGSITYVYLFSIIALFILLIACINFMNLSTARSASRAKEVGVRKVLGSSRTHLIRQFMSESLLYSLIAMLLALFIVEISLPFFNQLADKQLMFNFQSEWYFIAVIPVFVLITGLIAGSYPAFYLSAFQPLQVIKGQLFSGMTKSRFRSLLVLFQYSVSIVLLIATMLIYKQLDYMQSKNLGYDKEQVVVVKRVNGLAENMAAFKHKLMQNPDIEFASYSIDLPGDDYSSNSMGVTGRPADEVNIVMTAFADFDFPKTMGLRIKEGRWFERGYGTDSIAVVLNEAAMRALDIQSWDTDRVVRHATPPHEHFVSPIIGVVEDFHYESLHRPIRPMAFYLLPEGNWANRLAVKVRPGQLEQTIASIEKLWYDMGSGQPFEYALLDQSLEKFYRNDVTTRTLYTIFSLLALFVASLGLFGLATYTTESRTREIGIRKVLGASEILIVRILSAEFAKWVLLANIIAWPVAYLLMDNWLDNFAYRIEIPWYIFVLSGLFTLIIALFTVLYQAVKAARSNPVDALKYE
jgi:putative ABC transport system permease protein